MKTREEWMSHAMDMAAKLEHQTSYGRKEFVWIWGVASHIGVWAFGGTGTTPQLGTVLFRAPDPDAVSQWICYIGPPPIFKPGSKRKPKDGS